MAVPANHKPYILGLDIGTNSVGWAAVELRNGIPSGLLGIGVRVFPAGVEGGSASDVASGRYQSSAKPRRDARLQRRRTWRLAQRLRRVFRTLRHGGLLPAEPAGTGSEARHRALEALDAQLRAKFIASGQHRDHQLLPYLLRARGLDAPLEPFELGRAFYHIAQRRGFRSNRLAPAREGEDDGVVKRGIGELEGEMQARGARTLGEYLSGLDPETRRIRARWTSRAMYEDEFERLWSSQRRFLPDLLTWKLYRRLRGAIFAQRPLRSQRALRGRCELEPTRTRAAMATLEAQRFRLLQKLNDLRLVNEETGREEPLGAEQRERLLAALESKGELTFKRAARLIGIHDAPFRFNLEHGGEKKLTGNRTAAKIIEAIGKPAWDALFGDRRTALVTLLRSIENESVLAGQLRRNWGLGPEAAAKLAAIELEPGFCSLSKKAIRRLLPALESGTAYATAVKEIYPGRGEAAPPVDLVPRVAGLRNPIVERALTETRKVVNALVRTHGKPELIRIELARDLKRSKKARERISKENRRREAERETAAQRVREFGIQNPGRKEIEAVLLAEECDWTCPYTGRHISMEALLGPAPQFEVEHIIPLSRSLDDSFLNRTLCYNDENRNVKRHRTPWETYARRPETWDAILARVRRFKGTAASEKLRRFGLTSEEVQEEFSGFVERQMNDTRYASVRAAGLLGRLFGGQVDADGRRRIQVTAGGVTAHLRSQWNLNKVLGPGDTKSRADHRHHAIDALVIALTDSAAVKRLADAAESAWRRGRRWFDPLPEPWPSFADEVRSAVVGVVVSHRPRRRVRGAMHEETYYAVRQIRGPDGQSGQETRVRKPVSSLKQNEIEAIVDPVVRRRVRECLEGAGGGDPGKAFAHPDSHPFLEARDGRRIPIHSVRVRKGDAVVPVGAGPRARHVVPGGNHHLEVFEEIDKKGRAVWNGVVVSRLEAQRRLRERKPIVQRDHGPGLRFLFAIHPGDVIERDGPLDRRELMVVRTVSVEKSGQVEVSGMALHDARLVAEAVSAGGYARLRGMRSLQKRDVRPVSVDLIGRIRRCDG